jgi:hypothetical protein
MDDKIVPFGKYRGQPVEALAADRQYFEWLCGQAWFRERYQNIHTLIVNNFAEPNETPEHNRLQMRFLDDEFCADIVQAAGLSALRQKAKYVKEEWPKTKESIARDIALYREKHVQIAEMNSDNEWKRRQMDGYKADQDKAEKKLMEETARYTDAQAFLNCPEIETTKITHRKFEVAGWDIAFIAEWIAGECIASDCFALEIKPSLGDDFPAVLRQMKARRRYPDSTRCALIIDDFAAIGATFDQVKAVFAADGFAYMTFPK